MSTLNIRLLWLSCYTTSILMLLLPNTNKHRSSNNHNLSTNNLHRLKLHRISNLIRMTETKARARISIGVVIKTESVLIMTRLLYHILSCYPILCILGKSCRKKYHMHHSPITQGIILKYHVPSTLDT